MLDKEIIELLEKLLEVYENRPEFGFMPDMCEILDKTEEILKREKHD